MSQNDLVIANQSFPSFRTDLNSALQAINTSQSGTSRPSGAVAGTIWLDTTSATTPTLKYYDGADDISLATLDHSANTVNWLDSTVSVTGLTTTATGTVLTLSDTATTSTVNLIIDNDKEIRFREATANGTNYVSLSAPASLSADLTFQLPSADGTAGQFLSTNGSGVLSFTSLSFATPLAVVGNATAGSQIRLPEDTDNGSNYVAIKAPDSIASNLTLTLPSADGTSGQVLQTNGSGVLSFVSGGGKVLQVVSTQVSSTISTTINIGGSFEDISGLSATITPSSASNKILVIAQISASVQTSGGNRQYLRIVRASTEIAYGDSGTGYRASAGFYSTDSNATINTPIIWYDTPNTTSATTYKFQGTSNANSQTFYVNRSASSQADSPLTPSQILLLEIAG